jgi:hypothetical protein
MKRYPTLAGHAHRIRGHRRAWRLVVALLVVGLWLSGRFVNFTAARWPDGLGDLGWQHLAEAAQSSQAPVRGLQSDAEMIGHFQAHRAEFEKLVALYQKHGHLQRSQPEYQEHAELLKSAGVSHLSEDGEIWLPDPYSTETAKRAKGMDAFHAYAQHGLMLRVNQMIMESRVQGLVWKDYFYVPVVPRVEQGRLWWPRSRHSGALRKSARVFDSLDTYPPEWIQTPPKRDPGGCVYRQIEAQWFLRLCTGR